MGKLGRMPQGDIRTWLGSKLWKARLSGCGDRMGCYIEVLFRAVDAGREMTEGIWEYVEDMLPAIRQEVDQIDSLWEVLDRWGILEQEDRTCGTCRGSGIGQSGDPEKSRCHSCGGSGVHRPEEEAA